MVLRKKRLSARPKRVKRVAKKTMPRLRVTRSSKHPPKNSLKHELVRVQFSKLPNGSPEVVLFVAQGLHLLFNDLGEKKVGIEMDGLSGMDQSHDPKNPFHVEKKSQVIQLCLRHGLYKSHDQLMAVIPTKEMSQIMKDHEWICKDYLTKIKFCTQKVEVKMIDDFFNVLLIEGEKKSIEKVKKWLANWCQSSVRFTTLPLSLPV